MRQIILAATTVLMGMAGPALADGGTLYFGLSAEPPTMDAHIQAGTAFRTVKLAIHRGLLNYGTDGELSQELAESYEVAPDAQTLTFHLREAFFHDGSPVTSADVKATFDRIMAPGSAASLRSQFEIVDSIETPDDRTVVITLNRPSVSFLHYLALPEAVILPAAWLEENLDNIASAAPVGAGPFRFVEWARGEELVIERFDDYYKEGKPYLDEVVYQFYTDENTRMNAIRTGDVDIVEYVPARDMASVEASSDMRLESTYGPFMGLQFNTSFEPFSHPEVRRAVAHAVDRSVIVATAFDGLGAPNYGLAIPEGYPGYDPEKADFYTLDYDLARELLAEAGYPDGFTARLVSTSQYSFHQNTAIAVQSELAKIGITVTLDMPDWTNRMAKVTTADYDFAIMGTVGEITDPDWLSQFYYGGENLVRTTNAPYFSDPEIDALLDEGRATVDADERAEIYSRFVDRALELAPIIFLNWRDQSYAVSESVSGFVNMPAFLTFQSGFSLEDTQIE
ncbi:ABC transporter substrate-binding protein [Aureimonas populi]|uniref:ABC transporter substrate-binding protein n=1 Tax=Aureimonas populi TaxID=1701758 RepID=A0ABW5CNA5_9HYPH|nr:ABC transporter substrate-binding protein [Aureimonas populi]